MEKLLNELRAEEKRLSDHLKEVRNLIKRYASKGVETEFSIKMKNINLELGEVMFFPCDKSDLQNMRCRVLVTLTKHGNGRKYKSNQTEGGFNLTRIL